MNENERACLTIEQAMEMLPDGDKIHVFLNPAGMLLGCDWSRAAVIALIKDGVREKGGETCTQMEHGLVVFAKGKDHFIQTKPNPSVAKAKGGNPR